MSPYVILSLAAAVIVLLVAYYAWVSLINVTGGGLKEWVDADFPEIKHTPKATWLTGFRYKQHGMDVVAKLETPICLEYEHTEKLGRFSVVDTFARAANPLDGKDQFHEKDLVAYDFGMDLEQLVGGKIAVQVVYNRISITEIEPIIEESACE
ncbi:hypothetical protein D3C81_523720 [compost metagenome]